MKLAPNQPCPCHSGHKYKRCCRPLHGGQPAHDPEQLMRSRFAAYAAGLVEYLMDSTDTAGPLARADRAAWGQEICAFCSSTEFRGLELLGSGLYRAEDHGQAGWVRFRAELVREGQDAGFVERSEFRLRGDHWRYHSGELE